jgi:hypothetical protein
MRLLASKLRHAESTIVDTGVIYNTYGLQSHTLARVNYTPAGVIHTYWSAGGAPAGVSDTIAGANYTAPSVIMATPL